MAVTAKATAGPGGDADRRFPHGEEAPDPLAGPLQGQIPILVRLASAGCDASPVCELDTEPQIVVSTGRDSIRPVIMRAPFVNQSPWKHPDILAGHKTFLSQPELEVEYESRWIQQQSVKSETEPFIMEERV